MFSWYTNDGVRILDNVRLVEPLYMIGKMPDGEIKIYVEKYSYDGYGNFGGKDYYVFLAEMNGYSADKMEGNSNDDRIEALRERGIELAFAEDDAGMNSNCKYPTLCFDRKYYNGVSPKPDHEQGWGVWLSDVESGVYDLCFLDITEND